MSADQKPFWFNNLGGTRALSIKGMHRAQVKSNHAQTRDRYTYMSWWYSLTGEDRVPPVAVLFKGEGSRSTRSVSVGTTFAQWALRGSYRSQQMVEYLGWALPPC